MQEANHNEKARILFVDDEKRVLNSMRGMFRRDFELFLTTEGAAAVKIAAETPIDVIVADQRMPGMTGIEVLGKVKELSPGTIRILLTGYADPSAVEGSINVGEVFRFLGKPCPPKVLRETLELAVSANRAQYGAPRDSAVGAAAAGSPPEKADAARVAVPAQGKVTLRPAPAEPAVAAPQPRNRSAALLSRLTSIGEPPIGEPPVGEHEYAWDDVRRRRFATAAVADAARKDLGVVVYTVDAQFAETALRALSKERSTTLATSLIKVMDALERNRCGVLVTDISTNGARLQKIIAALKQLRPALVTIVVSDTRDTTDMVNLINRGQIFRYLQKPVTDRRLHSEIEAASAKSIELETDPAAASRHVVALPTGAVGAAATLDLALQQTGVR